MILGGYNIQLYKSEPKIFSTFFEENGKLFILVDKVSEENEAAINLAHKTALTQIRIMDLMNAPGNYKSPEILGRLGD